MRNASCRKPPVGYNENAPQRGANPRLSDAMLARKLLGIMKASFELTRDDLVAFVTYHNLHSPTVRRKQLRTFVIGTVCLAALPALILTTTDDPVLETAVAIWPLLLGPILFIVFMSFFLKRAVRRAARGMIAEADGSGYFGPCSLSITRDSVVETKPDGQSVRKLSAVKEIVSIKHHVLIYTSSIEAFILPKRAFDDDDQCREFTRRLAEYTSVEPAVG